MKSNEISSESFSHLLARFAVHLIRLSPFACGTVIRNDTNAKLGYMLAEPVSISDVGGQDPRKDYPKKSQVPKGATRTETVAEWWNEGDEVTAGFVHDHSSPYTTETPRGSKIRVRATSEKK